jgi:AcrR family transcriptional regulator
MRAAGKPHRIVAAGPQLSLREALKEETRSRLQAAAVESIARHGYRATTVDGIVQAAGTTRTTFYKYFSGKADMIHVLQTQEIAPALTLLCRRLDALDPLSRQSLRNWMNDYARTWQKIHVFFEAYGDASREDPAVAARMLPDSYAVTGAMTRMLGIFEGAQRQSFHDKLVIMFANLSAMLFQVAAQGEPPAQSRLLDEFTDIFWEGMFCGVAKLSE